MAKITLIRNGNKKYLPLNLLALKSYLNQTKHQSWIFDLVINSNTKEELNELIKTEKIDFVGITTGSYTYKDDLELARRLKKQFGVKLIFGGVFASIPNLFDDVADYIIHGRGFEKLLRILDSYDGIQSRKPIEVIYPRLIKFDDYIYPKDLENNKEFPLYLSSGCRFQCIYCSIPVVNRNQVKLKSPSVVAAEIEEVIDMGIRKIRIVDDMFGFNRSLTNHFIKKINKIRGLKGVYTQLRIDCTTKKLLKSMRNSNFTGIYYGIESSNEETLRRIGKPFTRKKIENILKESTELEFKLAGAFTIGYPWEKKEDILNTINFAGELSDKYNLRPSIYIVTPFPNTPLSKQVPLNRIKVFDYQFWDAKHAVMDIEYVKNDEIQEIYNEATGRIKNQNYYNVP